MQKYIIIILLILITISCGKKDPVSNSVSDPTRQTVDFNPAFRIFPQAGGDVFYDSDIAVIQQGPGSEGQWGTVWQPDGPGGKSWSVAVALSEWGDPEDDRRRVRYRFLSSDGELSNEYDVYWSIGNIRLARVDACYFCTNDGGGTDTTYVEVSIVYQRWVEAVGGNHMWKINVHRLIFNPADIISEDWANLEPVATYHNQVDFEYVDSSYGHGQMMPDIAYDPRSDQGLLNGKGDIYVVFTWYDPGGSPHVYYRTGTRSGDNHFNGIDGFLYWGGEVLIQNIESFYPADPDPIPLGICHGFHPRIDIGYLEFFPELQIDLLDWYAVVVFTADDLGFEPHMAYWKAGSSDPPIEYALDFGPYGHSGFMPTVDVGPRDTNHCAIAWTQARSESWNDVTVGYIDTHFGFGFLPVAAGPMESFAFPSVAVWEESPEPGPQEDPFIRTSLSYLQTLNPNSVRWTARARSMDTTLGPSPVLNIGVGVEILGNQFPGDYDSGSQYSNWYGMSTSMTVVNGNYWVLWSAVGEDNATNLTQVCGAYGYTED